MLIHFSGNPNHHQRERRLTLSDPLDGIGDIEKFLIKMNFKLMERDVNLKVRIRQKTKTIQLCASSNLVVIVFKANKDSFF